MKNSQTNRPAFARIQIAPMALVAPLQVSRYSPPAFIPKGEILR